MGSHVRLRHEQGECIRVYCNMNIKTDMLIFFLTGSKDTLSDLWRRTALVFCFRSRGWWKQRLEDWLKMTSPIQWFKRNLSWPTATAPLDSVSQKPVLAEKTIFYCVCVLSIYIVTHSPAFKTLLVFFPLPSSSFGDVRWTFEELLKFCHILSCFRLSGFFFGAMKQPVWEENVYISVSNALRHL